MEEYEDLREARQVLKDAGIDEPNMSKEDLLDIYKAIKNSVKTSNAENSLLEEFSEEHNLNNFTDEIDGRDAAELPCFKPWAHFNPENRVVSWKYIPLMCTDKYLNASVDGRVQILLEDYENTRKHRMKVASRSFIRAPLPPPIDLLNIKSCNINPSIFTKHKSPPRSMKRKNPTEIDVDQIDENSLASNDSLQPASENHTASMANSWENNSEDGDELLFKKFIKRKRPNETKSLSMNINSTVNLMNGNYPVEDVPRSGNVGSNSYFRSTKTNKNVMEKSAFIRNPEDESNAENKWKQDEDLFQKDSDGKAGCKKAIKRERQLKPFAERNANENNSKITILSVHNLTPDSCHTVKKQCSATITPKKLINPNPPQVSSDSSTTEMLMNNLRNQTVAEERDQARINKFESQKNVTIEDFTDHEEEEVSSHSFGGIKTTLNKNEGFKSFLERKRQSQAITPKRLISTSLPLEVPTRHKTFIDIEKERNQVKKQYEQPKTPPVELFARGIPKSSCLFPSSPKRVLTRSEMLFDNLKKENVAKERDQAKMDKFNKELNEITIEAHIDVEEEENSSSSWLGRAETVLNINEDSTERIEKAPMDIYASVPSTSKVKKTDCPFCGKWFPINVIEFHVPLCERPT